MFKRVEKRRRRQEEEEELGINDELKQVLGIQDTDSEESDSQSDESNSDDGKDDAFSEAHNVDDSDRHDEEEGEGKDSNETPSFLMKLTVEQALKEPILPAPGDPHLNYCVLCPQKTLRSETIVNLHRSSNAHKRRFALFIKHSKSFKATKKALSVIEEHMRPEAPNFTKPHPEAISKRALKKEASKARRKANREKISAKAKVERQGAKESKKPTDSDVGQPPTSTIFEGESLSRKKRRQHKTEATSKPDDNEISAVPPATFNSPAKKKRRVHQVPEKSTEEQSPIRTAHLSAHAAPSTPASSMASIKSVARSASHQARAALAQSYKAKS